MLATVPHASTRLDAGKNQKLRILIVDDHPVVRKGLSNLLARCAPSTILAEAGSSVEALAIARQTRPELVLMDIELPEVDGFELTDTLTKEIPGIKVILLSAHKPELYANKIVESAACGYLSKSATPEEIVKSIETARNGGSVFSAEIKRRLDNQLANEELVSQLTPRELEVLASIAEGLSNKQIAERLEVGLRTIETHRERIMRKLNIHNIASLTKFAVRNNLTPIN